MIKQLLLAAGLFFSLNTGAQTIKHTPSQYDMNGTIWQQHSGEYKALCYQAFYFARLTLQDILHNCKDSMPLAVITDVDETVLDNSPSSAHDIMFDHGYTDSSWRKWTALAAANALPGAVEFFDYAAQHGVQCFYITNRSESEKTVTIKNLQQKGFPQADSLHVITKTTTSDKEPRRLEVAKKYNVVLLLGDNLNDFDKMFYDQATAERNALVDKSQSLFGTKYIVLPNANYGDWESALWKGKKPTAEEKDKIKWESLVGF